MTRRLFIMATGIIFVRVIILRQLLEAIITILCGVMEVEIMTQRWKVSDIYTIVVIINGESMSAQSE